MDMLNRMKSRVHGFFEGLNIAVNEPSFGGYIVPDLGTFKTPQVLVKQQLANGQAWFHKEAAPREDLAQPKYSFKNGAPVVIPEAMKKGLNGLAAFNAMPPPPEPYYPEDERVKALAAGNQDRAYYEFEKHHPPVEPLGFVDEAVQNLQLKSKYSPETFDRLVQLGFSEDDIAKAVQDEVMKDIRAVLDNPRAYTSQIDSAAALETMYEKWKTARTAPRSNQATGGGTTNPNNFRAAGTLGENRPLLAKTGAQRIRIESQKGTLSPMNQMLMKEAMKQKVVETDFYGRELPKLQPIGEYKIGGKTIGSSASSVGGGSNAAGGGGGGEGSMLMQLAQERPIQKKKTSVVQKYGKE